MEKSYIHQDHTTIAQEGLCAFLNTTLLGCEYAEAFEVVRCYYLQN